MNEPSHATRSFVLGAVAVVAAVFAAGMSKIADLDFWWHLRTGQLIASQRAIPRTDVLSFTAAGREYIDHEWLFQLSQYATFSALGPAGIAILKCVIFSITALLVLHFCMSRGVPVLAAVSLVFLGIAGGITRLIERPEIFSLLFAVLTYVILEHYRRNARPAILFLLPLICALWANVHAAVIVGLVIQFLWNAAELPRPSRWPLVALAASVIASGANPFGYRVLSVPFELTRIIDSGLLNNEEWRRPTLLKAPFFFLMLVLTALSLVRAAKHRRFAAVLIGAFLAYVSLKYIRNVGLFSMFAPMLIATELAEVSIRRVWQTSVAILGCGALLIALTIYYPFERGIGIASYFPDRLAAFVHDNGVAGNMLNSYGFGGYLTWALYPERRIFVDGRNEVFVPLMERLAKARGDSREWNALLSDYKIEYALLEYVDDLDRVTTVNPNGSRSESLAPVSAVRFPRSRWALVYWDDDGMLFVKRDGVNRALIAKEYVAVFPEGRGYQQQLVRSGAVDRTRAIAELRRKLAEDPSSRRALELFRLTE